MQFSATQSGAIAEYQKASNDLNVLIAKLASDSASVFPSILQKAQDRLIAAVMALSASGVNDDGGQNFNKVPGSTFPNPGEQNLRQPGAGAQTFAAVGSEEGQFAAILPGGVRVNAGDRARLVRLAKAADVLGNMA